MLKKMMILMLGCWVLFGESLPTFYDFEDENLTIWYRNALWEVDEDKSSMVLALKRPSLHSPFNLCYTDKVLLGDGNVSVLFRADQGREDQGGGIMWRVQDANNYYVIRFNPLENNFRFYLVANGNRTMIASADMKLQGGWHEIKISHVGDHLMGYLDGHRLIDTRDNQLPDAGGVGVWTKADALTSFDNLLIEQAH